MQQFDVLNIIGSDTALNNDDVDAAIRYIHRIIEKGPIEYNLLGVKRVNLKFIRNTINALIENGNEITSIKGTSSQIEKVGLAYCQARLQAYLRMKSDPVAIGFVDVDRKKIRDTDMIYASAGIYHNQDHKDNTEADPQYESWYGFTQKQLVGLLINYTRNIMGEEVEPHQIKEVENYVEEHLGLEADSE